MIIQICLKNFYYSDISIYKYLSIKIVIILSDNSIDCYLLLYTRILREYSDGIGLLHGQLAGPTETGMNQKKPCTKFTFYNKSFFISQK